MPLPRSHLLLIFVTVLLTILVMPSKSWGNSCTTGNLPLSCPISEATVEETAEIAWKTVSSFGAGAERSVVTYAAAHTLVNDGATFTNLLGADTKRVVLARTQQAILVAFSEGSPFSISAALANDNFLASTCAIDVNFLTVGICNDVDFLTASICGAVTENSDCPSRKGAPKVRPAYGSDSIGLAQTTSPVPEPGTLLLVGSGLVGSALGFRRRIRTT